MHLFIIRTTRSDVLRRKDHGPASSAIAVARTAKMVFNMAEMTPTMLCRQGERFDCKKAGRPAQQLKKNPLKNYKWNSYIASLVESSKFNMPRLIQTVNFTFAFDKSFGTKDLCRRRQKRHFVNYSCKDHSVGLRLMSQQ